MITILGGGIAGISAGYHLSLKGKPAIIFEKRLSWGGLCDNFEIDGFRFDRAIHLSFSKDAYVKKLLTETTDFYRHDPIIGNYFQELWLKHPIQNNLFPLPTELKVAIIKDFFKKKKPENATNFEAWLRSQFGDRFAETFSLVYNRKYWTIEPANMSLEWIKNRISTPNPDEFLYGAFTAETPNAYYSDEMRYPKKGGYKTYLSKMAKACDIRLNKEVIAINHEAKTLQFSDGSESNYTHIISSLPLPEIIKLLKSCPKDVKDAANKLVWTSVIIVSLGFKKKYEFPYLWFYVYDEELLPSRIYSPSKKSPDNAPKNCSSLQFEIYVSPKNRREKSDAEIITHVVEEFHDIGLFHKKDIIVKDCRVLKYGNVIFDKNAATCRAIIHKYLDNIGIHTIGRFGKWDYLWSDESLLTGKEIAEHIK